MSEGNPFADLVAEAEALGQKAQSNNSGDKYSAQAASKIIASNGRLAKELARLNKTTKDSIDASSKYNKRIVALTWVLVIGLIIQIGLAIWGK